MAEDRIFPLTTTDIRLKKDLGTDISVNKFTVHEKLDTAKSNIDEILVDTADIQPRLVDVETDVANLQTSVDTIDTVVDSNAAALANASTGLAAIAGKVDNVFAEVDSLEEWVGEPSTGTIASHVETIETRLGTPTSNTVAYHVEAIETLIGTPSNGTLSADMIELDSKIGQIQNNTRTVIALNNELELPATGLTRYFKVVLNNYDTVGNMEEPDAAPTVSVETSDGTSRSLNLGDWDGSTFSAGTSMVKISDGNYYIFYRLQSTENANEQLVFNFTIVEGGLTRYIVRTSMVVEEISSTFTSADRVALTGIGTDTDDIISKIGTPVTTVSGDIASLQSDTDSIESKIDIIDTNVDTIKDTTLPAIQTTTTGTYDRDTMSLEAIAAAIASFSASSSIVIWDAIATSGTIAATGGTETVTLTSTEGVVSESGIINSLIINPTTSCTDYTIEIFEDSALNKLIVKVANWNSTKDGSLNMVANRGYINSAAEAKLYVRITNDSGTAVSFNVAIRGETRVAA
jgi:hypothetical protein